MVFLSLKRRLNEVSQLNWAAKINIVAFFIFAQGCLVLSKKEFTSVGRPPIDPEEPMEPLLTFPRFRMFVLLM
jgi:hypothetical protein